MCEFDSLRHLVNQDDEAAWSRLFAMAYRDLRSLARAQLKSVARTTFLKATELLHESYLRFRKAGSWPLLTVSGVCHR